MATDYKAKKAGLLERLELLKADKERVAQKTKDTEAQLAAVDRKAAEAAGEKPARRRGAKA